MNEEPQNDLGDSAWPETALIIRMMEDGSIAPLYEWNAPDIVPAFLIYHCRTNIVVMSDGIGKFWEVDFLIDVLAACDKAPWEAFSRGKQINVSTLYASRSADVIKEALDTMKRAFLEYLD